MQYWVFPRKVVLKTQLLYFKNDPPANPRLFAIVMFPRFRRENLFAAILRVYKSVMGDWL